MLDRTSRQPEPLDRDPYRRAGRDDLPATEAELERVVQTRLGLVCRGLREASRQAREGHSEDAAVLVEKLAEDLLMLQGRVRRAAEGAEPC
jgi:hypothetical protein